MTDPTISDGTAQLVARIEALGLKGRSFLTIHDFRPAEVVTLLDLAAELKDAQKHRVPHAFLDGRAVAMIFMKTSTRTRELRSASSAGAQPMFLNANDIQLRVGGTSRTLPTWSRYVDCIMIRTFAQKDVEDLAELGQIPVINGLTDDHHPCQGMADALTIREHVGRLEGVRLVYIGDGNNVTHSLAEVGAKTGMQWSGAPRVPGRHGIVEAPETPPDRDHRAPRPMDCRPGRRFIYTDTLRAWAGGGARRPSAAMKAIR
jgi:ornithine carbamoyltransferase